MGAFLQMIKRFTSLCALVLTLASCGSVVEQGSALGQSLDSFRNNDAPDFGPRFIALIEREAASMQIAFVEQKTNTTMLLERSDGAFQYWLTADGAQVVLQSGMLHSARGLGEGLLASDLSQPLALVKGLESGWSDRFHTYLDGEDFAVSRTYRCRVENAGPREIDLFGTPTNTRLMRESCRSLDQEFVNLYWVSPRSRTIVLSRQWIGPIIGQISTRIVPK
jgi:hypothetical protein